MTHPISKLIVLGFFAATAAATASAGEWVLNENKCPDLIEDRIDQRVTTSRQDAIEDRQDMRIIECPRSAWSYLPSLGERASVRHIYTGPTTIYAGRIGYYRKPAVITASAKGRQAKSTTPLVKIVIR